MIKTSISTLILALCFLLPVGLIADPPPNDNCADATDAGTLSIGEPIQLTGTTAEATDDCEYDFINEVWIKFTITSCMNVTIDYCDDSSNPYDVLKTLYSECPCGNNNSVDQQDNCSSNDSPELTWFNLGPGTYYYSIGDMTGGDAKGGPYTINITGEECPPPPDNDNCVDADDAGTLTANEPVQLTGVITSATNDCESVPYPEVWVKFTLASCMDVTIDFCNDPNYRMDAARDLYDECPCGARIRTQLIDDCHSNEAPILTWQSLAAGTYYYPIWSSMGSQSYVVNINGVDCPLPPENDDCGDAIAIGDTTGLEFIMRGATHDGYSSCITNGPNIWFAYTASSTEDVRLEVTGRHFNPQYAIYDGVDCSPLPFEINCSDDPYLDFAVITGQQYLIEVGSRNAESGDGTLSIGPLPDPPVNDNCSDADDAGTLQTDVTRQLTGTTFGATQDCPYNNQPEVWIKFTVPVCMNITIDFCDDENYVGETQDKLYTDCTFENSFYASSMVNCENGNPSYNYYGIEAGTYYYPIIASSSGGPYTVNITGVECPSQDPDFVVEAPYTGTSTTCDAGNNCFLNYHGEDHIYEVSIPTDGNWYFSLCNSESEWESTIYLGTSACDSDIYCTQNHCGNGHSTLIASGLVAGTYYLTVDANNSSTCGDYTLDIDMMPPPCEGAYYTNGDPDYVSHIESYNDVEMGNEYFACDDFTITEDITLDSIKFICAESRDAGFVYFYNSGDYVIMADDNGAPGEILFEESNYSCSRVANGENYNDNDVFAYQFDNLDIELSAGTYFIACRPISSMTYWLTTDSQSGSTGYYKVGDDSDWAASEVDADLAFCLFGTSGGVTYEYLPGDANMTTGQWPPKTIGGDVTYLVNYFRGLVAPCILDGFYASADANGDCNVTGSDVTKLVNFFRGMTDLSNCPDYPTSWPPVPDTAPDGWPNCESPILSK